MQSDVEMMSKARFERVGALNWSASLLSKRYRKLDKVGEGKYGYESRLKGLDLCLRLRRWMVRRSWLSNA